MNNLKVVILQTKEFAVWLFLTKNIRHRTLTDETGLAVGLSVHWRQQFISTVKVQ